MAFLNWLPRPVRMLVFTSLTLANVVLAWSIVATPLEARNHCRTTHTCWCQDTGGETWWCDDWAPGEPCDASWQCDEE